MTTFESFKQGDFNNIEDDNEDNLGNNPKHFELENMIESGELTPDEVLEAKEDGGLHSYDVDYFDDDKIRQREERRFEGFGKEEVSEEMEEEDLSDDEVDKINNESFEKAIWDKKGVRMDANYYNSTIKKPKGPKGDGESIKGKGSV